MIFFESHTRNKMQCGKQTEFFCDSNKGTNVRLKLDNYAIHDNANRNDEQKHSFCIYLKLIENIAEKRSFVIDFK